MTSINYFEPVNLYKSQAGDYIMKSAPKRIRVPEMRPDYIEELKEMHRQYLINLKTGGPLRNYAKEFIDTYPFSAEEKKYVERKVFGIQSMQVARESKEEFKSYIKSLYFPLDSVNIHKNKFLKENKNINLWTDKIWREFKKDVFSQFITKNIHEDLYDCLDFDFHKKDDETIESLKSVRFVGCFDSLIETLVYNPKKLSTITSPSTTITSPSTSSSWKWDNQDEYKRLGISGKKIYEIKKTGMKNGFWVPILLDDTTKRISNSHYITSRQQFDVSQPAHIIALVAFNSIDNKLQPSTRVDLFDSSHHFQTLSLIDKSLNEALLLILKTKDKTEMDDFQRVRL